MGNSSNGNGKQKTFKIKCFYCEKIFKVAVEHPCFINKSFCNKKECLKEHGENKRNGGERYEKYKTHFASEKERHKRKKKFMTILFVDRQKKIVFRENDEGSPIRIGEIIPEDRIPERLKNDDYVFVIEGFGMAGRINQYRRDIIRGLL